MKTISTQYASKVRMAVRAALLCVTAFGLNLSAEQVAAVQLLAETLLQLLVKDADLTATRKARKSNSNK
jgi:hypothetical protein